MPITYEVLPYEGVIRESWHGDITMGVLRGHWNSLLRDEQCLRLGKSLADLRQATLLVSDQQLETAIREVAIPLLQGREWISAIVVQRSVQLRLASRYHSLAALFSRDTVFSQLDEAERWLLKQEHRSPKPAA